jgi:hypothetical protein
VLGSQPCDSHHCVDFPPQKQSPSPTSLSSLTVILQHRNGEWILTLHTHGQTHVERLGNECVRSLLMQQNESEETHNVSVHEERRLTPCFSSTVRLWEHLCGSFQSSRALGDQGRSPMSDSLSLTAKMCVSVRKSRLHQHLTLGYMNIYLVHSLHFLLHPV